jgi:hypothetical protein
MRLLASAHPMFKQGRYLRPNPEKDRTSLNCWIMSYTCSGFGSKKSQAGHSFFLAHE